jgi:DNA-binding transcriptional ArsR family regulator
MSRVKVGRSDLSAQTPLDEPGRAEYIVNRRCDDACEARMIRETERTLKALADRTRLRILAMVATGPVCVCQLVEILGLSQSTVSKHLSILAAAGLVVDERRGRFTLYRIDVGRVHDQPMDVLRFLAVLGSRDPDVHSDLERLSSPAVRALVRDVPVLVPPVAVGDELSCGCGA